MIKLNGKHKDDFFYILKEIRLFLYILPFYIIIYTSAYLYSMKSFAIIFPLIVVSIMLIYLTIGFVSQQNWLSKYNRIITRIEFKDDYLKLSTDKLLWKKAKTINIENAKIRFKKKSMYWWAKKGRDKTTYIFNFDDKEYYLIAEYFDKIDILIEKLGAITNNKAYS